MRLPVLLGSSSVTSFAVSFALGASLLELRARRAAIFAVPPFGRIFRLIDVVAHRVADDLAHALTESAIVVLALVAVTRHEAITLGTVAWPVKLDGSSHVAPPPCALA